MPTLTITTPTGVSQRYEISPNRQSVTLGRSTKSDIRINCESVSGQHAALHKLDDGYVLHDLGSTNGTKLDGKKVSEIQLEEGQKIHLGNVVFDFVVDKLAEKTNRPIKTPEPDGKPETKQETASENNPVVLGLAMTSIGLILLGFFVMLGIDAIKDISQRPQNFILGGGALIFTGMVTLISILFVTRGVKIPKLVVSFSEEEEQPPCKKKQKEKKRDEDEDKDEGENSQIAQAAIDLLEPSDQNKESGTEN